MKLRQKLAVVMASAMVVTAVPVVTMAASDAKVSKTIVVPNEDPLGAKAPYLEIELKDATTTGTQFYINLENAKFAKDDDGKYMIPTMKLDEGRMDVSKYFTIKPVSDTEAVVRIIEGLTVRDSKTDSKKLSIALSTVKVTGEAKISIDSNGTEISTAGPIVFANKSDAKAAVTVTDVPNIYSTSRDGVKLANIVITEDVAGRITNGERWVEIELDHSDYEFIGGKTIDIKGSKGFGNVSVTGKSYSINSSDTRNKNTKIRFELPDVSNAGGYGVFTIEGLKVRSIDREPDTGDLEIIVRGVNGDFGIEGGDVAKVEEKTVVAAQVVEFGTQLTVAEKKEVKSGKMDTVKITYKENTADSTADGDVDFILDKGYIHKIAGETVAAGDDSKETKIREKLQEKYGKKIEDITYIFDKDHKNNFNYIVGFTLSLDSQDRSNPDSEQESDTPYGDKEQIATEYFKDLELEISTTLATEGEITLTSSGRYVDEQSVVVMNATPNVKIEGESVKLKVGQTEQIGGKITISELEKGAFGKHSVLKLSIIDDYRTKEGISVRTNGKVTVDGVTEVYTETNTNTNAIYIEIDKVSKENPSTITLEDLEFTVDRTVPQGTYDLRLEFVDEIGNSIDYTDFDGDHAPYVDDYREFLDLEDFLVIGTPNEDELNSNGLPIGTATFTIGSKDYTVGDKTFTMDAAAYIQDPGYTMVPMRYVANAFGVEEKDILFSNGKATIFAGGRTIQLTSGSNVAVVNGVGIDMAAKVVIKEGRTYAPVGEIGRLLGIQAEWDSATKTAKFTNAPKTDK